MKISRSPVDEEVLAWLIANSKSSRPMTNGNGNGNG